MTIEPDYTLAEVAEALGMSERWVRGKVADGAAHQRYGHKIRFTPAQLDALRASHAKQPAVEQSITTGRKRAVR